MGEAARNSTLSTIDAEDAWAVPEDLRDVTREEALFIVDMLRREVFGEHRRRTARWRAAAWRSRQAERAASAALDEWLNCSKARHDLGSASPAQKRDLAIAYAEAEKRYSDLQRKADRLYARERRLFDASMANLEAARG